MRRGQAAGMSLVELLVAMAVIGILIGLLLPAVQQVRQTAARMQSQNHLRQLGLALHSYHDAEGTFPPGYQSGRWGGPTVTRDTAPGWSWAAFLLPYLEQETLHRQIRWDLPCWDAAQAPVVSRTIPVFLCPAAPNAGPTITVRDEAGTPLAMFGRCHYVANTGQDESWAYALADLGQLPGIGPFYRNSRTRMGDVRDGLSQTVFVGEHTTISDKTWVGVVPGAVVCPLDPHRFPFTECDAAATLVLCHSGPAPTEPGVIHPPSFPTCHVCQMYAPWPGGNVLFGDGSVRFIPTTINLDTWAALCSMRAGDTPGDY
jgi:prepilin-type N-terminal cleavage/methylation domain-containing protein/prepilin-type processing-associated H-X9-DG protein